MTENFKSHHVFSLIRYEIDLTVIEEKYNYIKKSVFLFEYNFKDISFFFQAYHERRRSLKITNSKNHQNFVILFESVGHSNMRKNIVFLFCHFSTHATKANKIFKTVFIS